MDPRPFDSLEISERIGDDAVAHRQAMKQYIRFLREHPETRKLKLNIVHLSTDLMIELGDAIANCTGLESLSLWNFEDPKIVSLLAPIAGAIPTLREFEVHYIPVIETGAQHVVDAFHDHPNLNRISLQHTMIGESGMVTLAQMLPSLPQLVAAELNESDGGPAVVEVAMEEALFHNPRIQSAKPLTIALEAKCTQNQERLTALLTDAVEKRLQQAPFNAAILSEYSLLAPAVSWRAYGSTVGASESLKALEHALTLEPKIPDGELSADWLITPDATTGYAPLDFPSVWEKLPQLAARMQRSGTPIGKRHLLHIPEGLDEPYLVSGVKLGHLEPVMNLLAHHGEHIGSADLIQPDGALSLLGQTIAGQYETSLLFRHENWQDRTPADARRFYAQLPNDVQAQVGNLHQLTATLGRDKNTKGRAA